MHAFISHTITRVHQDDYIHSPSRFVLIQGALDVTSVTPCGVEYNGRRVRVRGG